GPGPAVLALGRGGGSRRATNVLAVLDGFRAAQIVACVQGTTTCVTQTVNTGGAGRRGRATSSFTWSDLPPGACSFQATLSTFLAFSGTTSGTTTSNTQARSRAKVSYGGGGSSSG